MLDFTRPKMQPGMQILEIGGGRRPAIPIEQRPPDTAYACIDPDPSGLSQGNFTVAISGFVEEWHPELAARFDVVVSSNVLEHVVDLETAIANVHGYLKHDGVFAALFSGRWSLFSTAARLMPHSTRAQLLRHFLGRAEEDHFPVHYNRCRYGRLVRLMDGERWVEPVVLPLYRAATYLDFRGAQMLKWLYTGYENWSQVHPNLATHYIVAGRRRQPS